MSHVTAASFPKSTLLKHPLNEDLPSFMHSHPSAGTRPPPPRLPPPPHTRRPRRACRRRHRRWRPPLRVLWRDVANHSLYAQHRVANTKRLHQPDGRNARRHPAARCSAASPRRPARHSEAVAITSASARRRCPSLLVDTASRCQHEAPPPARRAQRRRHPAPNARPPRRAGPSATGGGRENKRFGATALRPSASTMATG